MNLPLRQALPLALLSASLCATSPAIALDRLCFLAGINFRPPAKAVRDQELKRLTAEVEKVKDDIATNSEHLDYWWELTGAQKCLPFGKADASAMYQHIGENISIFARAERRLKTELDTKKAALDDFLTTFSKIIQAEADNADNMDKCIAAAKAAPSAAAVSGEDKPAGPFSVELAINGQGCTATPNHNRLKEFDLKRGKDAPTPPLTLVAKMSGFYRRPPAGGSNPKECTGASCSWTLPGYKATDPIPAREDFLVGLKWLQKKDQQRDKGGTGSIVDGVEARVYVHYPAP